MQVSKGNVRNVPNVTVRLILAPFIGVANLAGEGSLEHLGD